MFREARGLPSIERANLYEPLFTTNRGTAFKPSYLSHYVTSIGLMVAILFNFSFPPLIKFYFKSS